MGSCPALCNVCLVLPGLWCRVCGDVWCIVCDIYIYTYVCVCVSSAVGGLPPQVRFCLAGWGDGGGGWRGRGCGCGPGLAILGWLWAAEGCGHVHVHSGRWMLFTVLRAQLRPLCAGWDE